MACSCTEHAIRKKYALLYLLVRCEISFARSDEDILHSACLNVDSAIPTVGIKVRRFVGERVLAAQFILDQVECVHNIIQFVGEEDATACFFCESL